MKAQSSYVLEDEVALVSNSKYVVSHNALLCRRLTSVLENSSGATTSMLIIVWIKSHSDGGDSECRGGEGKREGGGSDDGDSKGGISKGDGDLSGCSEGGGRPSRIGTAGGGNGKTYGHS